LGEEERDANNLVGKRKKVRKGEKLRITIRPYDFSLGKSFGKKKGSTRKRKRGFPNTKKAPEAYKKLSEN